MKKSLPVLSRNTNTLSALAGQAVMDILPVDQKTLQRASKLMEPKNIKRIAIAAVGGSALISVVTSIGHDRIYRAAVGREIKKQLEPLKKKLNDLEAQNVVLYQQNLELTEIIKKMNSEK